MHSDSVQLDLQYTTKVHLAEIVAWKLALVIRNSCLGMHMPSLKVTRRCLYSDLMLVEFGKLPNSNDGAFSNYEIQTSCQ